jgi:hypothetical protein
VLAYLHPVYFFNQSLEQRGVVLVPQKLRQLPNFSICFHISFSPSAPCQRAFFLSLQMGRSISFCESRQLAEILATSKFS